MANRKFLVTLDNQTEDILRTSGNKSAFIRKGVKIYKGADLSVYKAYTLQESSNVGKLTKDGEDYYNALLSFLRNCPESVSNNLVTTALAEYQKMYNAKTGKLGLCSTPKRLWQLLTPPDITQDQLDNIRAQYGDEMANDVQDLFNK
jgi:hypothetical protein